MKIYHIYIQDNCSKNHIHFGYFSSFEKAQREKNRLINHFSKLKDVLPYGMGTMPHDWSIETIEVQ